MGIKRLETQILRVENMIIAAQLSGKLEDIGRIGVEFTKLKFMLDGLTSFVEHRWEVKLFDKTGFSSTVNIRAEHLDEAREIAINMCDDSLDLVRYDLYCDGILIPEEN